MYTASRICGYGLKVNVDDEKGTLMLDRVARIRINRNNGEKSWNRTEVVKTDVHGIGDKGPVGGHVGYAKVHQDLGDIEFQNCLVEVEVKKRLGRKMV